jgi:hypothetical protein
MVKINRISKQHFLQGREEADAFKNGDYVSLHQSTLKKVDVIHHLAEREWLGTLKTNATLRDEYGTTIEGLVDRVTDHWSFKVLGFVGIMGSIIGGVAFFALYCGRAEFK